MHNLELLLVHMYLAKLFGGVGSDGARTPIYIKGFSGDMT